MQAAHSVDQLMSGPQKQVISVGQQDLHAKLFQIALRKAFHRGLRTDGHENGRFDCPVWRVEQAGARAGSGALGEDFEGDLGQV